MNTKDRFGNELSLDDKVLVPVESDDPWMYGATLEEGRVYNITTEGKICVAIFDLSYYEDFESKDVIKLPIGGAKND